MDDGRRAGPVLGEEGLHLRLTEVRGLRLAAWTTLAPREPPSPRGAVVVLPGLAVSAYLRPAVAALAGRLGRDGWLLELPGCGGSDDPGAPVGVREHARFAAAWLAAAGLAEVVLVGHSYGAQLAPRVAAVVPDRVRALVLADPTPDPSRRSLSRLLAAWLADGRLEPPALVRSQLPEWRRAGARQVLRMLADVRTDRIETLVAAAGCPVLVVRGGRDPLTTPQWCHRLAGPGQFVSVPGGGHSFPMARPDLLAGAVARFVAGYPAVAAADR